MTDHEPSKLAERVNQHDMKLVKIETILERVAVNQEKATESILKIEKLLTKLDHIEENTKESFERVHRRIDDVQTEVQEFHCHMRGEHKTLEPVVFALRYPKLTFFTILGLYLFTIKEFREILIASI